MVNKEILHKRLANLGKSLKVLKDLQKYSFDQFIGNPLLYGSAERFLHLSIEALIDIGNHIISDLELGEVHYYADIPSRLGEHGYLNDRQKNVFIKMIGFRNALVHEYIEIDRKIVFDIIQSNLHEIQEIQKIFAAFIE
jgi:uncharacterized protein YutE (UPF0331/DUF86 family)